MGEEDDDGVYHDEVEIEDFVYDEDTETFTYPCPCGDLFAVSKVNFYSVVVTRPQLTCSC